MAIILGIDPGSRITGYGIIASDGRAYHHIASGSIKVITGDFCRQLQQIFIKLVALVDEYHPEEAAIEQVFVHANINSALKLGQARGAAIAALAQKDIKIAEYATRMVKQAVVGTGGAAKAQVQYMTKLLLKLKALPEEDEADALAIAICHANMSKLNLLQKK